MDNVFSDLEQVVEALTGPLGDYAPLRRHLMVDYKDEAGPVDRPRGKAQTGSGNLPPYSVSMAIPSSGAVLCPLVRRRT